MIYGEGKGNAFRRLNRELKYRIDKLPQTTLNNAKHRVDEFTQATLNNAKRYSILQQTLKGHSNTVTSVAFSPNSRRCAAANAYGAQQRGQLSGLLLRLEAAGIGIQQ